MASGQSIDLESDTNRGLINLIIGFFLRSYQIIDVGRGAEGGREEKDVISHTLEYDNVRKIGEFGAFLVWKQRVQKNSP